MTNTTLKPCSTCKDGVYIVKAGTDECADCGRKEITPPAPVAEDAVEALGRAMNPHIPDNDKLINAEIALAENVAERLAQRGYTLRRETMTDAELGREAENLANCYALNRDKIREKIVDLAKKYRG